MKKQLMILILGLIFFSLSVHANNPSARICPRIPGEFGSYDIDTYCQCPWPKFPSTPSIPNPNDVTISIDGGNTLSGNTTIYAYKPNCQDLGGVATFEYSQDNYYWSYLGASNYNDPVLRQVGVPKIAFDADSFPTGTGFIRATVLDNCGSGSNQIQVFFNRAPVASADGHVHDRTADLNAEKSTDSDGSIQSYEWNFGDGTTGSGKIVSHPFAGDQNIFYVTLKVKDNLGATNAIFLKVDLSTGLVTIVGDCGCDTITLKITGSSSIPMGWNDAAHKNTLGPVNTINLANKEPYYIWYNFEVDVKLKEGSDPSKCTYGQTVKGTFHWDSKTAHKSVGGIDYPYSGGTEGSDNYNSPSTYTKADGANGTISWVDGPGYGDASTGQGLSKTDVNGSGAQGVSCDAAFTGFAHGNLGNCDLAWEYHYKVDSSGNVVTAPAISNIHVPTAISKIAYTYSE